VDDGPASSVDVLLSYSFHVAVEFEFYEARREDVESSRWSVLDDHDWVEVFGDDFAEAWEILDYGFWMDVEVR
jgi:hypothetical protein